jgi:hypothetical protein
MELMTADLKGFQTMVELKVDKLVVGWMDLLKVGLKVAE